MIAAPLVVAGACSSTDPAGPVDGGGADLPARIAAAVDPDSLMATVVDLEGIETRFVRAAGHDSARSYLKERIRSLGFEPEVDSFTFLSGTLVRDANLVVTLAGRDSLLVLLGAHYDSFQSGSDLDSLARSPGADDNGTGVACVLEAIRVLRGYRFRHTLSLVFFSAEEVGRHGSAHLVADLTDRGDSLLVSINLDMLGFDADTTLDADLVYNAAAAPAAGTLLEAGRRFGGPLGVLYRGRPDAFGVSDHLSFWSRGLPGAWLYEGLDDSNPQIHSATDLADRIDRDFFLANARTAVAGAAILAGVLGGAPPASPPVNPSGS